jgi:hypothetical protein
MAIEMKIMKKPHLGMLGFSLDEGSINLDGDTENTRRGGLEGGLSESINDLEYIDKGNPIAVPAPVDILSVPPLLPCLRCSHRCSPKQLPHAPNNNKVRQQETNVNNEGMTLAPAMDARAVLRKAESSIKAQKRKNLSNKHKECTFIVGVIVKLIKQGQGSYSGMSATMSMTLMC